MSHPTVLHLYYFQESEMLILGDFFEAIISAIYPTLESDMAKPGYIENEAINEEVDITNEHLLKKIVTPRLRRKHEA
ncbi:hypothetical protein Tco_1169643 [Tanacetum coccineum]